MIKKRNYQYRSPESTEQQVEAIYEELSETPNEKSKRLNDTLKDYIIDIHSTLRKAELNKTIAANRSENSENFSIGILASIILTCFLLNLGANGDIDWLNNNILIFRIVGVSLAAIFLGIVIERSSFFTELWKFNVTKFIATISFSALVIFSYGTASAEINSIFGIDASAMPFTRAITTGIYVIRKFYFVLFFVGILALVQMLGVVIYAHNKTKPDSDYENPPLLSIAIFVISLLFIGWCIHLNDSLTDKALPKKIYRLAHILDFNTKHTCKNLPGSAAVIFMGDEQAKVLVDETIFLESSLQNFLTPADEDDIVIPPNFPQVACDN